jgi:hypothetical protein
MIGGSSAGETAALLAKAAAAFQYLPSEHSLLAYFITFNDGVFKL